MENIPTTQDRLNSTHLAWLLQILSEHKRNGLSAAEIQDRMDTRFGGQDVHLALWKRLISSIQNS